MRYLLDVNALIAFGHTGHGFHHRISVWSATIAKNDVPQFATTPITELGFIRILSRVYSVSIAQAQELLNDLKSFPGLDFEFIADDLDASKLPNWVKSAKHTTDGHLAQLAVSNHCLLATFDNRIPGAFVIPS